MQLLVRLVDFRLYTPLPGAARRLVRGTLEAHCVLAMSVYAVCAQHGRNLEFKLECQGAAYRYRVRHVFVTVFLFLSFSIFFHFTQDSQNLLFQWKVRKIRSVFNIVENPNVCDAFKF